MKDLVRVKNQKGTESAKQIAQNAPTMSGDATTEKDANAAAQANVYSQLTAKYGNNKKQETRGRKSLRQIAAGLQKKIEMLKTNQVEMEIFLKRVESHIDDIRGRSGYEIIAENKLAVHEYEPDVRKELLEVHVGRG